MNMTFSLLRFIKIVLLTAFLQAWIGAAFAASQISGADNDPAIDGYDAVAYFTVGKPVLGDKAYTTEWKGATWLFASAEHRDLFVAMPEKYAPQYGGYCAYAAAHNGVALGHGEQWKVVDDKLYLNNNWFAQKLWKTDIPGNIGEADKNWPKVQEKIEVK